MNRLTLDTTLTPDELGRIKAGKASVHERAQQAVHNAGLTTGGSPNATPYRPGILYADPRTVKMSPRWPNAVMRIKRILEGAAKSSTIEGAANGAEYSALAKRYLELYAFYMTRTKPAPLKGNDHNPFRNLSDFDAARMFVRRVEDLCDASTGKLGAWATR